MKGGCRRGEPLWRPGNPVTTSKNSFVEQWKGSNGRSDSIRHCVPNWRAVWCVNRIYLITWTHNPVGTVSFVGCFIYT